MKVAERKNARRRKTVLVVDDHPSVREALRLVLASCGYDCVAVGDGAAALAQLRAAHFDLVITDYEMPNMNGLELLDSLSAARRGPAQPVILHTANKNDTLVRRAMTAGAFDVLPKPAEAAEVIATVRQAMRGR